MTETVNKIADSGLLGAIGNVISGIFGVLKGDPGSIGKLSDSLSNLRSLSS
jgi:hypothetical protein